MKIKLVHILTEVDTLREIASINSLSPLSEVGIDYIQQINVRYSGEDWKETPAITQNEFTNHGPGHYGAFQSFKKAMIENFSEDLDALVLCECDCVLSVGVDEFTVILKEGIEFCNNFSVDYLSLGSRYVNGILQSPVIEEPNEYEKFYLTNKIILAHCIVLPARTREYILESLEKFSWDSPDIWFNEIFWNGNRNRFGIVKERLAYQHEGISLIDNYWKDSQ
jgi:hypothetical protein